MHQKTISLVEDYSVVFFFSPFLLQKRTEWEGISSLSIARMLDWTQWSTAQEASKNWLSWKDVSKSPCSDGQKHFSVVNLPGTHGQVILTCCWVSLHLSCKRPWGRDGALQAVQSWLQLLFSKTPVKSHLQFIAVLTFFVGSSLSITTLLRWGDPPFPHLSAKSDMQLSSTSFSLSFLFLVLWT